jgi:hypothetical protein
VVGQNYLETPFQKLQTFGKVIQVENQYFTTKIDPSVFSQINSIGLFWHKLLESCKLSKS